MTECLALISVHHHNQDLVWFVMCPFDNGKATAPADVVAEMKAKLNCLRSKCENHRIH